jgi:hypothetical protein
MRRVPDSPVGSHNLDLGIETYNYTHWQSALGRIQDLPTALSTENQPSKGHSCQYCIKIPLDKLLASPGERYELCDNVAQLDTVNDCVLYRWISSSLRRYNSSDAYDVTDGLTGGRVRMSKASIRQIAVEYRRYNNKCRRLAL